MGMRGIIRDLQEQRPLIHHMTNYVAMTAVADVTAAVGASPVVARSSVEAYDMVRHCSALVLNMGTPDSDSALAMIEAGEEAGRMGIPVLLDPVGLGSTEYRHSLAEDLLRRVDVDAIRGNGGEIAAMAGEEDTVRGVESRHLESEYVWRHAVELARSTGAVVATTGEIDWVTDGRRSVRIDSGHPMMASTVGTGCLCSAVAGCFLAVGGDTLSAVCLALQLYGLAGERAAASSPGPVAYRNQLIDSLFHLTRSAPDALDELQSLAVREEE